MKLVKKIFDSVKPVILWIIPVTACILQMIWKDTLTRIFIVFITFVIFRFLLDLWYKQVHKNG